MPTVSSIYYNMHYDSAQYSSSSSSVLNLQQNHYFNLQDHVAKRHDTSIKPAGFLKSQCF